MMMIENEIYVQYVWGESVGKIILVTLVLSFYLSSSRFSARICAGCVRPQGSTVIRPGMSIKDRDIAQGNLFYRET